MALGVGCVKVPDLSNGTPLFLLPQTVMTFPEPNLCPLCHGDTEWRCLDDEAYVWRLYCLGCGAELEGKHDAGTWLL